MLKLLIGIDFDNTIVSYDQLIHTVAYDLGLISGRISKNKTSVRDTIRGLPDGDVEWQKVQAMVYGPRILEATVAPGATEFLLRCVYQEIKVHIVSHKTEFANYDVTQTNLRAAAVEWLETNLAVKKGLFGISLADVYFESSRREKIKRVSTLRCTHFIDDLMETFEESNFPDGIRKILYTNRKVGSASNHLTMSGNWYEIADYLFKNDA